MAEEIGAVIGAGDALPRFDTAEFLAMVSGEELRRLGKVAGLVGVTKTAALRAALVGRLPDWRPSTFTVSGGNGTGQPLEEEGEDDDSAENHEEHDSPPPPPPRPPAPRPGAKRPPGRPPKGAKTAVKAQPKAAPKPARKPAKAKSAKPSPAPLH